MLSQPSKVDVVDLFICQITSQLYFDELSIFEYSKTEFSFQSVADCDGPFICLQSQGTKSNNLPLMLKECNALGWWFGSNRQSGSVSSSLSNRASVLRAALSLKYTTTWIFGFRTLLHNIIKYLKIYIYFPYFFPLYSPFLD